jgi:hypothetical protein
MPLLFCSTNSVMAEIRDDIARILEFFNFENNLFEINIVGAEPAKLFAEKINLPTDSLDLEYDNMTGQGKVKGYSRSNELGITFHEPWTLNTQYFFHDWLAAFYNRTTKTWKTGAEGKKRDAIVFIQAFSTRNGNLENTHQVTIQGMIPKNISDLELTWDSGDRTTREITFMYDDIVFEPLSSLQSYWHK